MFTGIIQAVGRLRSRAAAGPSATLVVECPFERLALGESVAVDGVCLTVATVLPGAFTASASAETLARTTLGSLSHGQRVNLERALAVGDRLGGHIVAGHVDGVGRVAAREEVGTAERVRFDAPAEVMRFVAEKGSVAIDGVSLTVNALHARGFEVMLVPFTRDATALGDRAAGAPVNLEVDVIARYVARWMEGRGAEAPAPSGVTMDLLARHGFVDEG
jgi:riboflavin synthase